MFLSTPAAVALAEHLCRPRQIGILGHRGVGKTTLLTMLYREAAGGRLADLRLAAGDARTADYLSDKISQLEAGQPLPGTLAETVLRLHLYHHAARLELLFKDYQGEHIELGREESVRDFLRDCDALWICLDAGSLSVPADRWRRQQEVEQLIEDYLAVAPGRTLERPVALLLTKADLLEQWPENTEEWSKFFSMTRHALRTHCLHNEMFTVSSLDGGSSVLDPRNLSGPLTWLTTVLQALDESRLERLWTTAAGDLALLLRCVSCFTQRYPEAPATAVYQQRLSDLRRWCIRRRGLFGAASAACVLFGLGAYDALGYHSAARFQAENAGDPTAVVNHWQSFQAWHPTRNLLQPGSAKEEDERLADLRQQSRQQQCAQRQTELRRQATDPDADPESVWRTFREFRVDYPEVDVSGELQQLRAAVQARRDAQLAHRAYRAYEELLSSEPRAPNLTMLLTQAERFLSEYPGTAEEPEVRRRRDAYVRRIEEQAIETARNYSARQPLNFQTRREHYQRYLDKHPGGPFQSEAENALRTIEAEWDRYDFRLVRDHFLARPGDIPQLLALCRTYLAVHPNGRFSSSTVDLLRWSERITAPGEYRVVLRNGSFDRKVAHVFSRGPKLSVELEVNGVRYGPSNIIYNQYDPEWDFEFPRKIRWKLGDAVRIRVMEHSWKDGVIIEITSGDGDPLAMKMLKGEVWSGKNRLTFASDFWLPRLPAIE